VIWKRSTSRLVSSAEVTTDSPARYAKQLVSHLGRKVQVDETPDGSVLTFGSGRGVVTPGDGVLVLRAEAEGPERLAEVQDVLGRHLERFGQKAELVVSWSPAAPLS
jgi:hypothetical protein